MVGRRTRATGASPGGFKSLDDIPKPTRGKGKKVKTEPVESSIESESADPFITPAENSNNIESQKPQSPPTNVSRTNSPDTHTHSPSPTPVNSRLDSHSTSPPPKHNITSNDASSDNDVIIQEQDAERIAPLGSNRKRSRVQEPSTHQSVGTTKENAEEDGEERVSKRTRRQLSLEVEHIEVEVEAEAEAEQSTEPEPAQKRKGRPRANHRAKSPAKKSAPKTRGRKQDPIVLDDSSSDEAAETTASPPPPPQSQSKSTPRQPVINSPFTPHPVTPYQQQESSSADEDESQAGSPTISHPVSKLTLPSPDVRPVPQTEVRKPAPSLTETGPDLEQHLKAAPKSRAMPNVVRTVSLSSIKITPGMGKTERLRQMLLAKYHPERLASPTKGKEPANEVANEAAKEVVKDVMKDITKEVAQGNNDVCSNTHLTNLFHSTDILFKVAQNERKKTTAVASSSETLSKSDAPYQWRQPSPGIGMKLTDPYIVAMAKAFIDHKDKSKSLPSVEQVKAFLDGFDSQKPAAPLQPQTPRHQGFVVPDSTSDEDTVMSDDDSAEVVEEPKTPEAQIIQVQEESPRSSWWNPISTVATLLTSPWRKQATSQAPVPKLVAPPFIFNQPPPTTPSVAPLKRMSKSDRKRNTRNNVAGRLGGFQTERRPRHKEVERTPVHKSGLLTPDEVRQIHKEQDEYAAKHGHRGPSIVANHDIHKEARSVQRAKKIAEAVEQKYPGLIDPSNFTHVEAKPGDKRKADDYATPVTQRWNDYLSKDTFDDAVYGPRWVRMPNGLYVRAGSTDQQFEKGTLVSDKDPEWSDRYRDINAFPKQDIYKPCGVQNPLNSAQLLEQASLREQGVPGIPDESENDYTYVTNEHQKRVLFYPRSPYNMFDVPGKKLTAHHMANIKEGLPLLNPRDEYGIAIKLVAPNQKRENIFEQMRDREKKSLYKDAVEMKAGRILEPKQWTQTPPPKPKPGNAKLPGTVDEAPATVSPQAPAPAPMSEAVQHAMKKANKYLPAKSSGLRQVSNMSPLQIEQEKQDKGKGPAEDLIPHLPFSFDLSEESVGFKVDPMVRDAVLKNLGQGLISITPVPGHIWDEHNDLEQGEVESAVAGLFKGIDAREYGSMHNGLKASENGEMVNGPLPALRGAPTARRPPNEKWGASSSNPDPKPVLKFNPNSHFNLNTDPGPLKLW